MFGFGKKKAGAGGKGSGAGAAGGKGGGKSSGAERDALKAAALANVRKARAEIGEDSLDKLAEVLRARGMDGTPKSEKQIAEEKIRNLNKERLADNLRAMMDDGD